MSNHIDHNVESPMGLPHEGTDGKKVGLPKPPLFTSDYIAMAEILQFAMERFGHLILALMYYTTDGTMPTDLPPDINMMFAIYQRKIDAAREKYNQKCATNAKNGAQGGKAKAENAKKKSAKTGLYPPTQKQFRDAVEHFIDVGDISEDITDYETDSFFDELKAAGWSINGKPIQCRADWESAIKAKFFRFNIASIRHLYYPVFCSIFADFYAGEEKGGGEWADGAAYDFLGTYDEASHSWIVGGERFRAPDWGKALAKFMEQYSESSDT